MIAVGIRTGDRTHHQDQFILSKSFSVIKISVSNPQNPMPDEELVELDIFISSSLISVLIPWV